MSSSTFNNTRSIKAYFTELDKNINSISTKTNFQKYNCEIEHTKFSINFLTIYGESFNVTLKNEIIDIYPITNGIIIKIKEINSDFQFFKSEKINDSSAETDNNFTFYYLINHPLSSLLLLNYQNKSFDIIKSSINFPFLIIKEKEYIKLCVIMINKIFNLNNFRESIDRLVTGKNSSSNNNNVIDNFSADYTIKLVNLFTFENLKNISEKFEKIKFYKIVSHKTYLYIAMHQRENLFIYKIKFNNNYEIKKTEYKIFNDVVQFYLLDSLINPSNELLYSFRKNKNDKNVNENNSNLNSPLKFLIKNNIYTNNKTLIFLQKKINTIFFVEDFDILFSYEFNLEDEITSFKIIAPNSYYIYNNEKNIEGQMNLYFNLNEKNLNINILKYLKYEYGEDLYYQVLSMLFQQTNKEPKKNHLVILNNIIFSLFALVYNKSSTNVRYQNFFNDNLEQNYFFEFNENMLNILKKYQCNDAINSFIYFLKGLYENIKIYNTYDNSISVQNLLNLLFNLLKLCTDENIIIQYLKFFNNNYNITFLNQYNIKYTNSFVNTNNLLSYLDNYDLMMKEKYIFNHMYNIHTIISDIQNMQNIYSSNNVIHRNRNTYNSNDDSFLDNTNNNSNQFIILTKYTTTNSHNNFSNKNFEYNFLLKFINCGYNINTLKNMHINEAIIILNEISKAKYNPYYYTQDINYNLKMEVLALIDRKDLAKNILIQPKNKKNTQIENISSMLYRNISSDYNREYYLTKIKFNEDNRIEEVNRILSPTRILKIESSSLKNIEDFQQLEADKFILVYKNLVKQYTSCIGNGALNLNTINTFPKEILLIQPLNEQCLLTSEEMTYKFNKNSELLGDKDFADWTEFNNGVAQSLKLCTENFNNKSYIRNWILFNKPDRATFEHGGFLLGMGLLKQLDSLYATDVYQYMKTTHEGITIGILLGKSASKLSSMEETLSRTLCLHISFLIPTSLEISIPMNIQCSAVIGIGLLYLKSDNRLMTEMLINQLGKISNNNDKGFDLKHLNSYNLSLGFAIGLINLGHGKMDSKHDINYEEKIFSMIYLNNNKSNIHSYNDNKDNNNSNNDNNKLYNINQTTPAGFACLTLYYLQTKNTNVLSKIRIPTNLYQLDSFKPFHLYLAILCKNLISWDNITNSINWVNDNIPPFIKQLHESSLEEISNDISYSSKINIIDFSQLSTCYYYSLSAGLMSLGFKYCGTNNNEVCKIIIYYIKNILLKATVVNDIIIRENVKYDENNKRAISKRNLDECLCIASYALSLVMSGSGDLECLKLLKIIRKKVSEMNSNDFKNFYAGFITAVNHSIGILFLGNGGLVFNRNINSLAFLYIATFPIFNKTLNDNERYLQPLRHLYVLACENKLFETRDIDTNNIIQTKINVEYLNGNVVELMTPINLDNFDYVKKIYMKNNENYFNMEITREDIDFKYWNNKENSMKTKIAYIKKKELSNTNLKLLINQIDINNSNRQIIISKINDAVNYLKNITKTKNITINKICIDEIENILNDLQQENNFDFYFIKVILLLLVDKYITNENKNLFLLINDKLTKVRNLIKNAKCDDFETFDFFINKISLLFLNKIYCNDNNNEIIDNDNDNIPLKVTFDAIKEFIIRGLNESYKNNLKNFIMNFINDKLGENIVDWNLLKYIHLFKINLNDFCGIVKYIIMKQNEKNDILSNILENPEFAGVVNENNLNFIIYVERMIKDMK